MADLRPPEGEFPGQTDLLAYLAAEDADNTAAVEVEPVVSPPATRELVLRPMPPDVVVVPTFGWEPKGRLAELAARPDPDEQLSLEAARLVFAGRSKNTRDTYAVQWRKFVRFCGETGRVECPATPATVIEYMNHLWRTPGRYGQPTAPSSVRLALAVIAVAHKRARRPELDERGHAQYGYVSPTEHPTVTDALRGYTQQWLAAGFRPDTAYPLSKAEMAQLVGTLDGRSVVGVQKATILCVGYDMGGRRSELAAIDMRDLELHVSTEDPEQVYAGDENGEGGDYIVIHVPMSKTDQDGEGDEVVLFAHQEFESTCPVRWTLRWLQWRRRQNIPDTGPFLLQVRYGGPGPRDGRPRSGKIVPLPVSGESFEDLLVRTSTDAGLHRGPGRRKHIVPHSLRAGSATEAGAAGAEQAALNAHFRWSQKGTTSNRYVRAGRKRSMNPVRRIFQRKRGVG